MVAMETNTGDISAPAWPLSDKLPPKKAFPFIFISGGRRVALCDEEAMEENSLCWGTESSIDWIYRSTD